MMSNARLSSNRKTAESTSTTSIAWVAGLFQTQTSLHSDIERFVASLARWSRLRRLPPKRHDEFRTPVLVRMTSCRACSPIASPWTAHRLVGTTRNTPGERVRVGVATLPATIRSQRLRSSRAAAEFASTVRFLGQDFGTNKPLFSKDCTNVPKKNLSETAKKWAARAAGHIEERLTRGSERSLGTVSYGAVAAGLA